MGLPKAELVLGTESMVQRQSRLLHHVCARVAIVGRGAVSGTELDLGRGQGGTELLIDVLPGSRGPLVGIYTALTRTRTEFNLILGCDLPLIGVPFLRYLSDCALTSNADITVPLSRDSTYQPLCAVYRRRILPLVRTRVATGKNRISSFFPFVPCRVISWPEIARAGFPGSIFANMNTPEDYEFTKRRLEAGQVL